MGISGYSRVAGLGWVTECTATNPGGCLRPALQARLTAGHGTTPTKHRHTMPSLHNFPCKSPQSRHTWRLGNRSAASIASDSCSASAAPLVPPPPPPAPPTPRGCSSSRSRSPAAISSCVTKGGTRQGGDLWVSAADHLPLRTGHRLLNLHLLLECSTELCSRLSRSTIAFAPHSTFAASSPLLQPAGTHIPYPHHPHCPTVSAAPVLPTCTCCMLPPAPITHPLRVPAWLPTTTHPLPVLARPPITHLHLPCHSVCPPTHPPTCICRATASATRSTCSEA